MANAMTAMSDQHRTISRNRMASKVIIFGAEPSPVAIDLLILTPGFPADGSDDSCVPTLQEYLIALRSMRPDLRIAVIATQYPFTGRRYLWNGIEVWPSGGRNQRLRKPLTYAKARFAAQRMMQDGRPQAVHSFWMGECAWLGQGIATRISARHVITLMGQEARDGRHWWQRLKHGSTMVALSERHADVYCTTFNEAILETIPFGLPASCGPHDHERGIDLLFCGSLLEVKRPLLFLEVVARLLKERPMNVVMIGDGPLRNDVERAIDRLQLRTTVTLRGKLSRQEVLRTMRASHVLLHTADFESQGFVFDEALAAGMRIVSTPVGSAAASERWAVAKDIEGLSASTSAMLSATMPPSPVIMHPVEQTVRSYLRLYGFP